MINMAKKKEEKKDSKNEEKIQEESIKKENKKVEKKVVNKDQPKLYSLEELCEVFGCNEIQMSSLFLIRGIDKNKKLSIEDARQKFKDVMI